MYHLKKKNMSLNTKVKRGFSLLSVIQSGSHSLNLLVL